MSQHDKFIPSADIEGSDVYSARDRRKVGVIHHLIIDKASGKLAYADVSFGGFLGFGDEHHRIPWQALSFDRELGGFVADVSEDQVKTAPRHSGEDIFDPSWEERLHEHYRVRGYWSGVA